MDTLNNEVLLKLSKHIEEKYGNGRIWYMLFLIYMIDMKTWKFPEHFRNEQLNPLLDEIEQDEELKVAFISADILDTNQNGRE